MEHSNYTIYNASAGSGKTFTIALSYLVLLLKDERPLSFKQVLGITFTNKAVEEMKTRILEALQGFSDAPSESNVNDLFLAVQDQLGLDKSSLQARSRKRLKELLHNYSYFDISTIDKFNHRLIRTFSKDLKLPPNFEVILNEELFLKEAVDALLNRVGEDKELSDILVKYAIEKIDSDTSWDISYDLNNSGKILFDETQLASLKQLSSRSPQDFNALKKILKDKLSQIEKNLKESASIILKELAEKGIEKTSFYRKLFPNYLENIGKGVFKPPVTELPKWIQNFSEQPLYTKGCDEDQKEKLDEVHPHLIQQFNLILKGVRAYYFWKNAYKNFLPFSVIHALNEQLNSLMESRSSLPISEFNKLISAAIKNQPVPFIYERIGERYRHYFIDEFQDTSVLQWENLVPLVHHALSGEDPDEVPGSLLLVGDPKQAIYRWRGGSAHQLIELYSQQKNPFFTNPQLVPLDTNYRSLKEIVSFNNDFFTFNSDQLSNPTYASLYRESSEQKANKKEGGWVQLQFLEGKNSDEMARAYCEQIERSIRSIIEKGYFYSDICVLTRSNKNAIAVATYLNEKEIPVISSESLLLKSAPEVQFLINLLYSSQMPKQKMYQAAVLEFLSKDKGDLKSEFIRSGILDFSSFLEDHYQFSFRKFQSLEVYDALSYALSRFTTIDASSGYIFYFLDFVYEYFLKDHQGIVGLLNEWEIQKESLSIITPEGVNAIKLMTIHKAKGLQFPFVIYPFADQAIVGSRSRDIWVPIDAETHAGFKELLLSKNEQLSLYSETTEALVNSENNEMELDSLNVLYVALTRAEKGLIVLTKNDINSSGEFSKNKISSLFYNYLVARNLWDDSQKTYNRGTLETSKAGRKEEDSVGVPYTYSDKLSSRYQLIPHPSLGEEEAVLEAQFQGTRWHVLMEHLGDESTKNVALDNFTASFPLVDRKPYETQLTLLLNTPELKPFYQSGVTYRNECTLFSKEGDVLRPDRLVFFDTKAVIIDYKTGQPNKKNEDQVNRYAQVLVDMGYEIQDKILVYIQEKNITIQHIY